MKRTIKILVISGISIIILFAVYISLLDPKKVYMEVFHKTGIIGNFNANHKLDGAVAVYLSGSMVRQANYKNGLLDGWELVYYPSGRLKSKAFYKDNKLEGLNMQYYENGHIWVRKYYKNDQLEGKEYAYFKNGRVKYTCIWKNGKNYGDLYYYFQNGQLGMFHTYDITGEKFNIIRWDSTGQLIKHEGAVISPNIYSKDKKDSVVVLADNRRYNNINDLYVTVSTPDVVNIGFYLKINNRQVSGWEIDNNTLKIANAFKAKGKYNISMGGELLDKKGGLIERNFVDISLEKN